MAYCQYDETCDEAPRDGNAFCDDHTMIAYVSGLEDRDEQARQAGAIGDALARSYVGPEAKWGG